MMLVDTILAVGLVAILPGAMLARSLARRAHPTDDRVRRYRRTILLVSAPLVLLAAWWMFERRSAALLGLGAPARSGALLIASTVALIALLAIIAPRVRRPSDPSRVAAAAAMLPRDARELRWFVAFTVTAGVGWEIVYRGYLFWAMAPVIGAVGAVAVMTISYGVAHDYRGPGALAAAVTSAVLFAGGYALSGSLWWLIVLHVGLPLIGLRTRTSTAWKKRTGCAMLFRC